MIHRWPDGARLVENCGKELKNRLLLYFGPLFYTNSICIVYLFNVTMMCIEQPEELTFWVWKQTIFKVSPCVRWSTVYQNHHFTFSFLYRDNKQLNIECVCCEQAKIYRELKFSNNALALNCVKYSFFWLLSHVFLTKIYMLQYTPKLKMTQKVQMYILNQTNWCRNVRGQYQR